MTIALGILATDGIVIAADTQEILGGLVKISGQKIHSTKKRFGAFAATGAGSAGYLDSINQQLGDLFKRHAEKRIEAEFRDAVRAFYRAHVVPMRYLPPLEQPTMELVIAAQYGKRSHLFASDHSTLKRVDGYVTTGIGGGHAAMLLSRLFAADPDISVDIAGRIAAYTVFHVKEHVTGCGKRTHVVTLKDGKAEQLSVTDVAVLEHHFANYLDFDAVAVNYIVGRPVKDEQAAMESLQKYLKSVRSDVQKMTHQPLVAHGWTLDWTDQ